MKYLKILFLVVCIFSVALGQGRSDLKKMQSMILDKDVPSSFSKGFNPKPVVVPKAALVDYIKADSMHNLYGMLGSAINPFDYDPDLDLLSFTMRGDQSSYASIYPSTGAIYFTLSFDGGATWNRSAYAMNFDDPDAPLGRYPSGSISNILNDTSLSYQFSSWPRLDAWPGGSWGDMGYGGNWPIYSGNPFGYAVLREDTITFDSNVPCFSAPGVMIAVSTLGGAAGTYIGTRFVRTEGTFTELPLAPSCMDTLHLVNHTFYLGGDHMILPSGDTLLAYAGVGHVYRVYHDILDSAEFAERMMFVTYSTNTGNTWSNLDTINLDQIAGLGDYRNIWSPLASAFRIGGRMALDTLGNPHIVIGLQKEGLDQAGVNCVIAEIFKESGIWKGRIIAPARPTTIYEDQLNYNCQIARNKTGSAFMVQYVDSDNPNRNADLFVTGKILSAHNWLSPVNINQTPDYDENIAHMAMALRHDGGPTGNTYNMWSSYALPSNPDRELAHNRCYIMIGDFQMDLSPVNFDYRPLSCPLIERTVTTDTTFPVLEGTVQNIGELAQTESFQVRLRIALGNTVVYAESVTTAGLELSETRELTFPGSFQPSGLGTYTVELKIKVSDQITSNNILLGNLYVVEPSNIALSKVKKEYRQYSEITGTSTGIHGDDTSHSLALPFKFYFDGVGYDSATFSSNGWVELGTIDTMNKTLTLHRRESRSVTASGALSRNLATKYDKTRSSDWNKAFSAWLEDMSTQANNPGSEDSADISYTTLGSAPNRVFVIQWKNMGARYEEDNRDTRLNFQVRMYETTNLLEFHYGPVVPGDFTNEVLEGDDFGAAIGCKDTTGGPYRYLDAYKSLLYGSGYGDENFLEIHINPLTQWPGPDSVIKIRTVGAPFSVDLNKRWNLVSNPLPTTQPVTTVFPTAYPNTTYRYVIGSGYQATSSLIPGVGYWTKFSSISEQQEQFEGFRPDSAVTRSLSAGWSLIGPLDKEIAAPSGGIVVSSVFGYSNGYQAVSTMKPGKGYWIKTTGGTLTFEPGLVFKENKVFDTFTSIKLTDKTNYPTILYLTDNKEINAGDYDIPTAPYNFDARFKMNQSIVEVYPSEIKADEVIPISLYAVEYPLKISWNIKNAEGKGFCLGVVENDKIVSRHTLSGTGDITISKGSVNSLVIIVTSGQAIPKEFALGQNYPNPFNPTTQFTVAVPKTAIVDVSVYDILGRKISTLLSGELEAKYYTVEWNSANAQNLSVSSGIYFIRMTSDQFSAVRKIMLMK